MRPESSSDEEKPMTTETTTQEAPALWVKKPVPVEARRFDPAADYDEALSVTTWCGGRPVDEGCEIGTLEGTMLARPGDWIIKGIRGEFYPVERSIFEETYEPAAYTDGVAGHG